MQCHNGSVQEDYLGPGLLNPHPFPGARFISCETCHGGDPTASERELAHVPRPLEIGDDLQLSINPQGYEYHITQTGVESLPDYLANDQVFTALDYLQFVNPGAVAVVEQGRGCATSGCHTELGAWMATSVMATGAGISSALMDHVGVENAIPEYAGWYRDTAADYGFRAASDPGFVGPGEVFGQVEMVWQLPEKAVFFDPDGIHDNAVYDASEMSDDVVATSGAGEYANQLIGGSPLHDILVAGATQSCGRCHLGDRGRNRQAGEYRSGGCSACHMPYGLAGRSATRDPNVQVDEPANPDRVTAPENSHPRAHRIAGAAKVLGSGDVILGIEDQTCGTCHRLTNETMLEYWGVRIDQHEDVTNNLQYPANPNTFQNSANHQTLFAPWIQNSTYQGMNVNQLLVFEDYDADGLDDTGFDVHYEAGMGCIDCHGGSDTHNGAPGDPQSGALFSRGEQVVSITCESCHGSIDEYATTSPCTDSQGNDNQCVADRRGNLLPHVTRDENDNYWLVSRVRGRLHYIPQTRDVVVDNNRRNPLNNELLFTFEGSYAMGRADGDPSTGIGPQQVDATLVTDGFAHGDRMDCVACHASWRNQRLAESMRVLHDGLPQNSAFSTIDGRPVAVASEARRFAYATPLPFFLGVSNRGRIAPSGPDLQIFFQYASDLSGRSSQIFAFSDRRGDGNNPGVDGRGPFGALGHGQTMAHTIRGRVDANNEGVRGCVACHLNRDQLDDYGADYEAFASAIASNDIYNVDFNLLQEHLGQNTGNELNSPFFVHMAAGLGSGLWYFDRRGCPVNPLDANADRLNCEGVAPADDFGANEVAFALDQPVLPTGVANASGHRPAASAAHGVDIAALRDGAHNPDMPGPLGASLSQRLADPNSGLILDSWIDANGNAGGEAESFF